MKNNKIILELLERVIALENEIRDIKKELSNERIVDEFKEKTDNNKDIKTRKDFRNEVIERLEENNKEKFNFRPANQNMGSGIAYDFIDEFGKDKTEAYKLYTSTGNSWFRVQKEVIETIINDDSVLKGIIFYTEKEEGPSIILVMNGKDLNEVMKKKGKYEYDKTGGYHFYIHETKDTEGNIKILEDRDKENIIDLTKYYNKFILD